MDGLSVLALLSVARANLDSEESNQEAVDRAARILGIDIPVILVPEKGGLFNPSKTVDEGLP